MSDISNKVVLVTGASSGIGEATARELAAAGAKLLLGARRTNRLERLAEQLGENDSWQALDVTDPPASRISSPLRKSGSAVSTCWSTMPESCRCPRSLRSRPTNGTG